MNKKNLKKTMKHLILFVLGVALLEGQTEGFILNLINGATNIASNVVGGVVNGASNVVGGVVGGAGNVIGGVVNGTLNTVNNVQTTIGLVGLGSQFLWDNALKPSLDVLHNSINLL